MDLCESSVKTERRFDVSPISIIYQHPQYAYTTINVTIGIQVRSVRGVVAREGFTPIYRPVMFYHVVFEGAFLVFDFKVMYYNLDSKLRVFH